jgi:cytochrome bd-type quinol oxidase subunit 2
VLYTVIGLIFGGLFFFLARSAARGSRAALRSFAAIGGLWSLVVGYFGLVAMLLWFATDHTVTRSNENILQANFLSLILAVCLFAMAFGRGRGRSLALKTAYVIAGLSVLGFVLQVFPGLDQFNGEIIGLLMPAHIGMALALRAIVASPTGVKVESGAS